jgi:hypothetical protein
MFSFIISPLAKWLYNLNPSLLPLPPTQVGDPSDICYLGPNGETSGDLVTLCGDLDHGMRPNLSSWYLSPERHVQEGLLVGLVAILILCAIPLDKITPKTTIRHPFWMRPITLFCMTMIMSYKYFGHTNKMYYMVMPCNMKWILYTILCFGPKRFQPVLLQIIMSYTGLAFVAVATPDTEDCVIFFEKTFFFLNHYILLFVPLAYIWNGSISLVKGTSLWAHFLWWVVACAWFAILYFPIATVLGVILSLNLNYMLNPPPGQTLCVGDNYRLISTICCAVMFGIWRGVTCVAEKVTMPSSSTTKSNDKKAV